jgi:arsenical pump membrane protein
VSVPAVEAVVLAGITLGVIVARPWDLNEGVAALLGALAALALGLVRWGESVRLELHNWNIFLFFLGMMAIAAITDQSGVFDALTLTMARVAYGRVPLLYLAVFGLGAVISLLFANDSAALVLTPIVYALVTRLNLDPLPFVFATTFIADTASVGLPVSNPLNVILADGFHLGLGSYVAHLWLPAMMVIVINVLAFLLIFRRQLRGRFSQLPAAEPRAELVSTLTLLALLAAGYLLAAAFTFPLGIVACMGAALLALNLRRLHALNPSRLVREISWPIFGFIAGMAVVVQALADSGVTGQLSRLLVRGAHGSPLATITLTTVGTALGANVINNLPMALVMVPSIHAVHIAPGTRLDLIDSTVLGCDLGPNLTHLGSLATFIWLFFLRRQGLDVSAWDYFRLGVMVTPLLLAGAIIGLWLTSGGG